MKKLLFSLILLAVCTTSNAQVNVEAGYASDFTVRGTSRAVNTSVVGITGVKDVADSTYVYGFNYFTPTKRNSAQNHSGLGMSYYADFDEWSFVADVQGNYHLTQTAIGNSIEFGGGVTFYKLPYISKFADISIYYWDDIDLDNRGVEFRIGKRFADVLIDNVNITPNASVYVFNNYTAYSAKVKIDYSKYVIRPFVELSFIDNDAAGSYALDNDYQAYAGFKYKF